MSKREVAVSLLAVSVIFTSTCFSADNSVAGKNRQLIELRSRISKLQESLTRKRSEKGRVAEALRSVENRIAKTLNQLKTNNNRQQRMQKELKQLETLRVKQVALLAGQRLQLVNEMRSAHVMGKQQRIKLLLNQQESAQVGRMMVYYGYLSNARLASMAEANQKLDNLQSTEDDITARLLDLQSLQQQARSERDRLDQQMQQRKTVVEKLAQEIEVTGSRLSQLAVDEKQLASLVESLRQTLADIPLRQNQDNPFSALKGKLDWPAQGLLDNSFGTALKGTDLKSGGVLIKAPEGGLVKSVSQGRVAFADWIRGFGLLLIIDHGEGYMSLYGHNQVLYKEVGEWVDTGEVIAALGRSGGYSTPGLYFELRYKGQPVNPAAWCSGKPRAVSG